MRCRRNARYKGDGETSSRCNGLDLPLCLRYKERFLILVACAAASKEPRDFRLVEARRRRAETGRGCYRRSAQPSTDRGGAPRESSKSIDCSLQARAFPFGPRALSPERPGIRPIEAERNKLLHFHHRRRKMLAQREVDSSGGASLAGSTDVRIQVFEMGELLSKIMCSFGEAFGLTQLYRVFLAISPHMRSLLKGPADSVRERWVHGMQPAYMASQFSKYYKMPRRRAMSIIEECFLVSRMQQSFLATNIAQSLLTQAMQTTLQGQELSCLPGVYPLCVAGIIF